MYENYCSLVTHWMHIQLSHGQKTLEEVGLMLLRNFLIAQSCDELETIGQRLQDDLDDHTVGEAA